MEVRDVDLGEGRRPPIMEKKHTSIIEKQLLRIKCPMSIIAAQEDNDAFLRARGRWQHPIEGLNDVVGTVSAIFPDLH